MKKVLVQKRRSISQGDVYKDAEFIEYAIERSGVIEISKIVFPYVVVLTQDCDLAQDFAVRIRGGSVSNHDKKLISVIVAPLYNAEHIYDGSHLSDLNLRMAKINKNRTEGKRLTQNQTPRYHYIEFPDSIPIVASVIDFKHYFTVNDEYLKTNRKTNFICQIGPLYREDISQRFSSYLSRIGLPEN